MTSALIYAIHRTHDWWRHVGQNLGFDQVTVLTDRRGEGDRWITDAYYAAYRARLKARDAASSLLTAEEVADVIARCRVLRWLAIRQSTAMVLAMADAMDAQLEAARPDYVISFPIDNYNQDVLARLSRKRGLPYFEVTASALPEMCMLMHRGKLITSDRPPLPLEVEAKIHEIADPLFTPAYVQGQAAYTRSRFLKTLGYFRIRAAFFKLYSWIRRDRLNTHYLDAQPVLGHKPRWRDVRVTEMVEYDWDQKLAAFPDERRVLFGLQLFPEAAIDYWVDDLALLRHEDMLVEIARRLTTAGYQVVVKDHPLQFGFRQTGLLDRLKAFENVVVVPYEVSGNALLARCGVNVTATGTLGLQAGLLGRQSVTCEAYYATEGDFVVLKRWADLETLAVELVRHGGPASLHDRQARIVTQLLRGSFAADFFSFRGFDPKAPNPAAAELGKRLGERLRALGPEGENWHGRHLPPGGGAHPGSPLN
ncbi:capsular polysaccharide export protein, LipB/KpsS family [Brevundimonas sp. Root1279]|uniref:capsular polysaccharide export protein, LipB/KpsS family n=1 Tax=Brevundimonas sp. Root1279 TaxID=1736443 RepID=UPI0006FD46C7|nr:hypothetical protein [Brevundimonas sp. Root1279]KQW83016.1 hypothetical protein ASC65_06675 [Brevundimonas sp. Root1279]